MRKTYTIPFLTLCLLLVSAVAAMAFGDIRYPDRPLNLRAARSAKAKWVGSLHPGQKVKVAFMKDGWVAVFEPDETRADEASAVGYSNAKYLLPRQTRVELEPWGELMVTPQTLNIRSEASLRGSRVGTLSPNERVKVDFPDGDWVMVFAPDATIRSEMNGRGYCAAKYFEPVTASAEAPTAQPEVTVHAVAAAEAAPEVVSVDDGKGQVGGAVASQPIAVQPAPVPPVVVQPMTVKASESPSGKQPKVAPASSAGDWGKVVTLQDDINLRKERTSSSSRVRTLKVGDRVRVDFLKNGWYAVFHENEVLRSENRALGYALRSLVDGESIESAMPAAAAREASEPPAAQPPAAGGGKQTMVIDRSKFKDSKRPDPTPNKTAHGYQYRLLEKSETKKYGETWITLKVFLSTSKLPSSEQLKDFSTTMWEENRRATKNLVVLIYLPGMDTEDLAYGVVSFSDKAMLELWVRKVALFGTDFL
jgi:uncharacterized protein YgiM (DUF1202 family)